MKLEDIYYFEIKKKQHPELFQYVQDVVDASKTSKSDKVEVERRLVTLSKSKGNEHVRQSSNFLAEASAFHDLQKMGADPHWVPEATGKKMPDLEIKNYPIEIKHLNSPRFEHEALANGEVYGGSVNNDYDMGLNKKVGDFISDSRKKFQSYGEWKNGVAEPKGTLYLFFSKSIDAALTDGIQWEVKMKDRVQSIADSYLTEDDEITVIVGDIDRILE